MDVIARLGYLVIGTDDLAEAVDYYARFVRLDLTEQVGRTAFMTGGTEHHWVRIEEGNGQGLKRVGYEVVDGEAFEEIRRRLDKQGVAYQEGGDHRVDRVQHWLRFLDPGGSEVEVFEGMYERGVAPDHNGVTLEKFLHAGWAGPNFEQTVDFYQHTLGFKPSDWVEDRAGFFRCADRFHHSLVILRGDRPAFNHFCIQVASLDDVMRFRNNALRGGVPLRDDILRHAPSGSMSVYIKDVARGFAVEYCVNHPQLDDSHRARILPATPESRDVWQAPLPDRVPQLQGGDGGPTWIPGTEVQHLRPLAN